jgi:hypothetical protein
MQLVNVLIKHCFAHFLDATVIIFYLHLGNRKMVVLKILEWGLGGGGVPVDLKILEQENGCLHHYKMIH